jgi:hypothetical protein
LESEKKPQALREMQIPELECFPKEGLMAICPEHGAYDGTCKKCQPTDPKPGLKVVTAPELAPAIPDADKYILRSFEVEALQAQIEVQQAVDKSKAAQQAMNKFAQTVFEALGIDPKDWILDAKSMTLVKREKEKA